jgi:hypothetical protein
MQENTTVTTGTTATTRTTMVGIDQLCIGLSICHNSVLVSNKCIIFRGKPEFRIFGNDDWTLKHSQVLPSYLRNNVSGFDIFVEPPQYIKQFISVSSEYILKFNGKEGEMDDSLRTIYIAQSELNDVAISEFERRLLLEEERAFRLEEQKQKSKLRMEEQELKSKLCMEEQEQKSKLCMEEQKLKSKLCMEEQKLKSKLRVEEHEREQKEKKDEAENKMHICVGLWLARKFGVSPRSKIYMIEFYTDLNKIPSFAIQTKISNVVCSNRHVCSMYELMESDLEICNYFITLCR